MFAEFVLILLVCIDMGDYFGWFVSDFDVE